MNRTGLWLSLLLGVAGCNPFENKEAAPPAPRPVLSMVVRHVDPRQIGFGGTIEPRYQTDRGFQVLGRIIAFDVSVGDIVKSGQVLARLDPTTLDLAVRSAESNLAKATSQFTNAQGAQERAKVLFSRQVSSQADLDAAVQALESAKAAVDQAAASLAKAREERGYASLVSDMDGVVTSTDGDVGQTVSPGAKVMSIARTDVREAVVDLPETVTSALQSGAAFEIDLQADPSISATGKVREIAPQADASTRTRRVRITLDAVQEAFRLGVTITAKPLAPLSDGLVAIPRTALLDEGGMPRVWLADDKSMTVRTVAVKVDGISGSQARISQGIEAGNRIVVAGVHSLTEGQAVRIDDEDAE